MAFSPYNPFKTTATINRADFLRQPLYETEVVKEVQQHIQSEINAIHSHFPPYTRIVCMGYKGVGKTTILYYIKDMLDKAGIPNEILKTLPESLDELKVQIKVAEMKEFLKDNYFYVMIDHPDEIIGD